MWYSEHAMKVTYRQRSILHSTYPLFFLGALAAGTVTVSAAVIADTNVLARALGALVYMAAHTGRTAPIYSPEGFLNVGSGIFGFVKIFSKIGNDLSQSKGRLHIEYRVSSGLFTV